MNQLERHRWDDGQLVSATLSGDRHAGDVLFARYDSYAHRIAVLYTSSPDAANEAVAAGRALAFEKLATLRDPDRFGAWMATIVRNSAASAQRQQSREVPRAELPDLQYLDPKPEDADEDNERLAKARAALLSLPVRDRKALELSVYERLPVSEVAAALMIDVNTAYQVLSRARKRARRAYLTPAIPIDAPAACQKCAAKTPDYIRGLQGVRAKVDAHVETCSACRARLAEMLAESSRIKGLFSFAPLGVVVSAKGLIRRATPTKTSHLVMAGAVGSVAVAAGALGAVGALHHTSPSSHHAVSTALVTPKAGRYSPRRGDRIGPTRTHPSTDPGPAAPRPLSAITPLAQPTKTTTSTTQPGATAPSAAAVPLTPAVLPATTTTIPEPGTLLTGGGSPNDARGWANAQWNGTPEYAAGPYAGTQSFAFDGSNGLSIPGLAQLNGNDFTVSFDLNTTEAADAAHPVDLIGYRTSCSLSNFFDVRLGASAPSGGVLVEFDTSAGATVLRSANGITDGSWHHVSITRSGTSVTLSVDGVQEASSSVAADTTISNGATWQVANGDPCIAHDGTTALTGSMGDIYVGPTADAPSNG